MSRKPDGYFDTSEIAFVNVTFACPVCDVPDSVAIDHPIDWECVNCDHRMRLSAALPSLPACAVCGNHELYKKKDFAHTLGMAILIIAIVLSTVTYYWYEKWWSWSFLIGSAIIDGVMYLMVGDVVVCYRCDAHHRGFLPNDAHEAWEITIGERYRQERMRLERQDAQKLEVRSPESKVEGAADVQRPTRDP